MKTTQPADFPGEGLHRGAAVLTVAPSGPFPFARIDEARRLVDAAGFRFIGHPLLDAAGYDQPPDPFGYLALDDRQRAELFQAQWLAPDPGILWCFRGGYGAARMLPHLDAAAMTRRPRLCVGFSDITALHLWLYGVARLPTLHGPNLNRFADQPHDARTEMFRLLSGDGLDSPLCLGPSLHAVRPGVAEGVLLGGNLSVLCSLIGAPWLPSFRGAVLLLEDVDEHPYRLDRLLTHLWHAGVLSQVAAVLLGEFTPTEGVDPLRLRDAVAARAAELAPDIPILDGAAVGHGMTNLPLPLGVRVTLDAAAGTLTPREPWCREVHP